MHRRPPFVEKCVSFLSSLFTDDVLLLLPPQLKYFVNVFIAEIKVLKNNMCVYEQSLSPSVVLVCT